MSLLLKQIFGLIKLLNSETGHNQIASGIAAGFVLGFTPLLSLQGLLVLASILLFRIQAGAAFLAAFFFAFVGWLLDPAFDALGRLVLEAEALRPVFTTMFNLPLVPFTRFNNSVVMGAAVLTIALSPFVFIVSRRVVLAYRETIVTRLRETKFWRAVRATSLYQWYYRYEQNFG